MRERVVEKYLHAQVTKAGGTTRKLRGRVNDPDRLVIWPPDGFTNKYMAKPHSDIHFVETKAPGKKARVGQAREHKRLKKLGCVVRVLDTKNKVDHYIKTHQWI